MNLELNIEMFKDYLLPILILSFAPYYYTMFSYSSYILGQNNSIIPTTIITGVANGILYIGFAINYGMRYDFILMVLIILSTMVQYRLIFHHDMSKNFFGAMSFVVNIFSKRLIILTILSLVIKMPVSEIVQDITLSTFIISITFLSSISTISTVRNKLSKVYMDTILADKKNIKFSVTTLVSVILILFVTYTTVLANFHDYSINYAYLVVGVWTFMGYFASLFYAYHFASLQIQMSKYKTLSDDLVKEKQFIASLEKEAIFDTQTGTYTRDVAIEQIGRYLLDKENFFIAYIDMNGLKYVNDNYGHNEGDFYIKSVADNLLQVFNEQTVARLGGDEFLVVGLDSDGYIGGFKTMKCFQSINEVATRHRKPYSTSISYGVVNVSSKNRLGVQDLISLADKRMYEHKVSTKQQRKTVKLTKD